MPQIIILTSAFPFPAGEQFLEDEIPYWSKSGTSDIVLMPATAGGYARAVPDDIRVDLGMADSQVRWLYLLNRFIWLVPTLASSLFIHELLYLRSANKLSVRTFLRAWWTSSQVLSIRKKLESYIDRAGPVDVVYSYWNEVAAYAACLLKRNGKVRVVVSRAHGFDLYEKRRAADYMPLKRQFISDFDEVCVLSEEARAYFHKTYGAREDVLKIVPLGVPLPSHLSSRSKRGEIHIVSVSNCIAIKRLDKILMAACQFADLHPDVQVKWTHLGDGPLLADLRAQSASVLAARGNLMIDFPGEKPNREVKNFYLQHPVDIFVNTSESEGIPVSIMEAMSAGVPAVAPNVGGISDLVNERNGMLLSANPTIEEIAHALGRVTLGPDADQMRLEARKQVSIRYNAKDNYATFVAHVQTLVSSVR